MIVISNHFDHYNKIQMEHYRQIMINIKWQSTLYKHHKQHSTTVYMYAVAASYKQIIVDSLRLWKKMTKRNLYINAYTESLRYTVINTCTNNEVLQLFNCMDQDKFKKGKIQQAGSIGLLCVWHCPCAFSPGPCPGADWRGTGSHYRPLPLSGCGRWDRFSVHDSECGRRN